MVFVGSIFFLLLVQVVVEQQPILNTGNAVNSNPKIPMVQLPTCAACTITAMPTAVRAMRIKFQLFNNTLFIKIDFLFDEWWSAHSKTLAVLYPMCHAKVKFAVGEFCNKGYNQKECAKASRGVM